jgi:hypothetical protein
MTWLSVAARNLTLAEEEGLDVFTNCSGCTATLSETRHLLEDEELRERANGRLRRIGRRYEGSARVKHVAALLRDEFGQRARCETWSSRRPSAPPSSTRPASTPSESSLLGLPLFHRLHPVEGRIAGRRRADVPVGGKVGDTL